MRLVARFSKTQSMRRELSLLLLASLSAILVLVAAIARNGESPIGPVSVQHLLLIALVAISAVTAASLIWHAVKAARRRAEGAQAASARLREELSIANAVLKAEPHILLFWDQQKPFRVANHALQGIPGVPATEDDLLRFGQWLEPAAAEVFKASLDALFLNGRAFNVILRTRGGPAIEAEGRTSGGRAVVRLLQTAGFARDLDQVRVAQAAIARHSKASRALLDSLPMPVWLRSGEGRITWVNQAYARAVEAQSPDEVKERQIELLELRQRRTVDRELANGQTYRAKLPLVIAGERKAHDVVVLALGDTIAAAAIDSTALEKVQGELDQQIAAYDRTLDRVATAIAIFNAEQRLQFFNAAYQKLWHLDVEWLRGKPTAGAILDRLREQGRLPESVNYREWKARQLAWHAGLPSEGEWWSLPDERLLHVMAEQRPDGGATYLYADETERLTLEREHNALIRVQRETLDTLAEGVAVFAPDGRLKLSNSAFARIWQLPDGLIGERPHIDTFIDHARQLYDQSSTWTRIALAVTALAENRDTIDGQLVRADASVIDYAAMPLPDGSTLLTFADVTDAKRYERALIERNEALVAADRMKSQFISHVSYELRTPLTNIIGFGELLGSPFAGELTRKQHEYLGDISTSSKTLLAIIDDILDLATIDAGALELKLGPVGARTVIDAAILGVRDRAATARLTLDIAVADDVFEFIADEARVRQVLYNLLANAIGFSPPSGTIRLSCWRDGSDILFAIEDEGIGMPADQQRRAFERFESRSHGSKHRGPGLGLAIVKSLVELHGGLVELHSAPGTGTRVTVRFPEHGRGAGARTEIDPPDFRPLAVQSGEGGPRSR